MTERPPAAQNLLGEVRVGDARNHQQSDRQRAEGRPELNRAAHQLGLERPALQLLAAQNRQRRDASRRTGGRQATKAFLVARLESRFDVEAGQTQDGADHV